MEYVKSVFKLQDQKRVIAILALGFAVLGLLLYSLPHHADHHASQHQTMHH